MIDPLPPTSPQSFQFAEVAVMATPITDKIMPCWSWPSSRQDSYKKSHRLMNFTYSHSQVSEKNAQYPSTGSWHPRSEGRHQRDISGKRVQS